MDRLQHNVKVLIFIIMGIWIGPAEVYSRVSAQLPYDHYSHLSAKDLFSRASKYEDRQMLDSALACYALCSQKYNPLLDIDELELTVNAMRHEAQLYFYTFYDYETGCERLAYAQKLCKQHNLDKIYPQILLDQAGLYHTYASQNRDRDLLKKAEKLYREAFDRAYKIGDLTVMSNSFINFVPWFQQSERLNEVSGEIDKFGQTVAKDTTDQFLYSIILYKGMLAILENNQSKARNVFLNADISRIKPRHQFKLLISAARSFMSENKIDSAIVIEKRILELCDKYDLKDGRSIVLRDIGRLYLTIGDTTTGQRYELLGLQSKDSLITVNHLDKATNMAFLEEMHKLHDSAIYNENKSKMLVTLVICLILLIIASSVIWIRNNYRNRKAMANAVATLDALQQKYEEHKAKESIYNKDISDEERSIQKNRSSNMDTSTTQILTNKITQIFLPDNESIYTNGFSINDVVQSVKSNPKYVSQIINQTYGCNFATLVSTLRVRESIKRIGDKKNYGNLTLEAIGASVGFGSRAAFNSAFKRLTGKTPKEYRNSLNISDKEDPAL